MKNVEENINKSKNGAVQCEIVHTSPFYCFGKYTDISSLGVYF